MNTQIEEWNESYRNRDNFVFYPHEQIIRFVSKYVRKRIGLDEFRDVVPCGTPPTVLDLGCGIGRHIVYCHEMGLDPHGIDLSSSAIGVARDWAAGRGVTATETKILQGDIRHLPWADGYFDFAVSHGVLDSMQFEIARDACREMQRVLKKGGLFYCDMISGNDSSHAREFEGEEIVSTAHEKGTIQFYYSFSKILALIDGFLEIVECKLIRDEDVLSGCFGSRYHLVLKGV
jgi:ubiquinone/menaquinone biosynthesis C-methylase UbiE